MPDPCVSCGGLVDRELPAPDHRPMLTCQHMTVVGGHLWALAERETGVRGTLRRHI